MSLEDMNTDTPNAVSPSTPEADELASESDGAIERIRRYFTLLTSQLQGRATGMEEMEEGPPEGPTGPG